MSETRGRSRYRSPGPSILKSSADYIARAHRSSHSRNSSTYSNRTLSRAPSIILDPDNDFRRTLDYDRQAVDEPTGEKPRPVRRVRREVSVSRERRRTSSAVSVDSLRTRYHPASHVDVRQRRPREARECQSSRSRSRSVSVQRRRHQKRVHRRDRSISRSAGLRDTIGQSLVRLGRYLSD